MLWIASFLFKKKDQKNIILVEMVSSRDRIVSKLKKEVLILRKQLDALSEVNAKLKIENEFYSDETAKKDILINGKNN